VLAITLAGIPLLVAAAGVIRGCANAERSRLRAVLGKDWGFCHTFERNARKVGELSAQDQPTAPVHNVGEQVTALLHAVEDAPKSRAWKLRSRVGERIRWYETPEEVKH
jgi:hypothetical protein